MERVLLLPVAAALLAGCQSQNPFVAFGPPTVPSPTTSQTAPYYPPTAIGPKQTTANAPFASPRISVSAEGNSAPPLPRSSFVADPADREPIRVVENPSPPTRTAAATGRGPKTGNGQPPAGLQPPAKSAAPSKNTPTPQSGYFPRGRSPAGSPPGFRADPAVVPAGYQQVAPTFTETPMADGQWRAK